jgi:hypothetical protein
VIELLDLRLHRVVISPHYRDATGNGKLAEMRADQKTMQEMRTNQAKTDANREADREGRKAERKADQEDLKAMMEEKLNANHKEMMAWREETDAETKAIQAKTEAMRDKRMEANMNAWRNETMTCQETTEARL